MKNTLAKVISALMITTMLIGFATVFNANFAKAVTPAELLVDPASSIFYTAPYGTTFLVNVSVANVTGLAGIQFQLNWDPTLLKCNSMTECFFNDPLITNPIDLPPNTSNVEQLAKKINNTAGTGGYGFTWQDGGLAAADGYDPANITTTGSAYGNPSYSWPNGEHGACTFNFTILQTPNATVPLLSCGLTLTGDVLGDSGGLPIAHTVVNGLYQNIFVIAPPYFSVVTQGTGALGTSYTAHSIGEIFNVTVLVNNLDASYQAVGFQFSLGYNASLLNITAVTEGPWLIPFGNSSGAPINGFINDSGTEFLKAYGFNGTLNLNYVGVGDVVLPDANGTWHEPFPSGTGVLAIITFNCTAQNISPAPDLTCPLTLFDTIVANTTANTLLQNPEVDSGTYTMKSTLPPVIGGSIDIFTGWPAPYGGQGPNMPSDMFWPQKAVSLYANVTYNGYAEQQKDVAFEIVGPDTVNGVTTNQTWAIIYARTNATGIALVDFRLPWPCDDPEQWFGVWTIYGTVDIACTIYNDTLQFHYDYLVEIFKQTVNNANITYDHGTYVTVNVTYGTYLQEWNATYLDEIDNSTLNLTNVTVVVTGLDEVQVPYSFIGAEVPLATLNNQYGNASILEALGGAPNSEQGPPDQVFSNYNNFTVTLTIYIPKFAVAGNSVIECAVLSSWPSLGGMVVSGYFNTATSQWQPDDPTPIIITNTGWAGP
jgi:hypothetical protein